ncbi:MAG TPA: hypothetical protein VJP02_24810 [Candidatus Sulfotelmatobacter sp.]|nr:hypothetical protein [Candidatus Sulfotelmatobacter sp.]
MRNCTRSVRACWVTPWGLAAVDRGDDRVRALRETIADLLQMDKRRKHYLAMMSGLDIH